MKIKNIFTILLLLNISSCAHNYEEEKTVLLAKDDNNTDLMKTFEIDKSQAGDFRVVTEEEAKIKAEAVKAEEETKPVTKASSKNKKISKTSVLKNKKNAEAGSYKE